MIIIIINYDKRRKPQRTQVKETLILRALKLFMCVFKRKKIKKVSNVNFKMF